MTYSGMSVTLILYILMVDSQGCALLTVSRAPSLRSVPSRIFWLLNQASNLHVFLGAKKVPTVQCQITPGFHADVYKTAVGNASLCVRHAPN